MYARSTTGMFAWMALAALLGSACLAARGRAADEPAREPAPAAASETPETSPPAPETKDAADAAAPKPAADAPKPADEPGSSPGDATRSAPPAEKKASEKSSSEKPSSEKPSAERSAAAGKTEPSAAEVQRDQKVQAIEARMRELLKEIEALRSQPAAPKPPAAAAKPGAKAALPEAWLPAISWRSIGPANMGGRIVDLAVSESDASTFWAATASGGLLQTTNNGFTLTHQFDRENTVSLGAVAVAPSDPNIVWVGTGESNPRNSVSYGDGLYKSTDGGKSWSHMGLKETYQIGRIVIHPKDPNTVYVAALGRLYGPHERRGVFLTTDGGQSWQRVLYVNDTTGAIDLRMHPTDPRTLIAALWEMQRDGFDSWPGSEVAQADGYNGYDPIKKWGPGSGLHKTTDGGRTWRKLSSGLPTGQLGRIGLDWCRQNPKVVYAVVDCEQIGKGPKPCTAWLGAVGADSGGKARLLQIQPDSPAAKAGLLPGDVVLSVGGQAISGFDELLDWLRQRQPAEKVQLRIERGADTRDFDVVLTGRPGTPDASLVWLGISGENRQEQAVLTDVTKGGPADKAGLLASDVILAVDDTPAAGIDQVIQAVQSRQVGDKVKLKTLRGQQSREVEVTLGLRPGRPAPAKPAPSDVFLGIQGQDAEGGARLTRITDGGPAAKAGLQEGDLVQAVAGKPIANYAALAEQIAARQAGEEMPLTVRRENSTLELTAIVEMRPGANRPYGNSLGGQNHNIQDQQGARGFEYGGVYRSHDAGETWTRVNSLNSRPMYFSQIRVDPSDENRVYVLGVAQYRSDDGGLTFVEDFGRGVHADGHALWIDPRDGRHMIIGTDGGIYVTYDRGDHWDHLNHAAIGQFYHVAIAPKFPYQVTGGLQDNGTWLGPNLSKNASGPINEDWVAVGGSDGFQCRVDPDDPDLIYYTAQNGVMSRRNLRTGQTSAIRPQRPKNGPAYRFNWNTPFLLSAHNPRIFWTAGNYVFRSINRGDNLQVMSPEITLTKRGSGTALAESPRNPDVLYVGTDDGALWGTRDGGRQWHDLTKRLPVPQPRWVATIEASRFEEGRVYVALDGHRSDDDEPYVFVSEDFGQTWKSLRANLPWGSTRCLREDLQNPHLLYLGTEFAAWCSIDRGQTWNRMNTNLPSVAIHEFAQHPENGELVAATHGRSLWVSSVSALRQIRAEHYTEQVVLYAPGPVVRWQREPSRGRTSRRFVGQNPPSGAQIYYSLPRQADKVTLQILDITGDVQRELRGSAKPGIQRLTWDLTRTASKGSAPPATAKPAGPVPEGVYRLVLQVDDQQLTQTIHIQRDPTAPEVTSGSLAALHEEDAEISDLEIGRID